ADGFLELMQENFTKKVTFPVTNDQLIIASLVEREARMEIDRPIVASVIYNRLKNDMAIDIDATVQYAIGRTGTAGWWKKDLTIDDLKFKSPYNTYLNPGLPPTPICNPGLSSINAAVNPAKTDYLFYISDLSGKMYYAQTLSEHNRNINLYLDKP
ncbi:MAG: endolytic transglycosylase MltG, partial [bacterium]|nr:endolytic transglycosylase MltG [bacterium]